MQLFQFFLFTVLLRFYYFSITVYSNWSIYLIIKYKKTHRNIGNTQNPTFYTSYFYLPKLSIITVQTTRQNIANTPSGLCYYQNFLILTLLLNIIILSIFLNVNNFCKLFLKFVILKYIVFLFLIFIGIPITQNFSCFYNFYNY